MFRSESRCITSVVKHGQSRTSTFSATDTPFIETLVAQKRPEDKSNDSSSGNKLQNDGVILQLRKICCTCIQAVSELSILARFLTLMQPAYAAMMIHNKNINHIDKSRDVHADSGIVVDLGLQCISV